MAETTIQTALDTLRAQITAEELKKCETWLIKTFADYVYRLASDPETPRVILSCYTVSELDKKLGNTKLPVGWRTRQHVPVQNLALLFHETILTDGFDKLEAKAQMRKLSEHSKREKRGYEKHFDSFPNWQVDETWLTEENAVKV